MKDTLLNQALMNAGPTSPDGGPDPGDCCTVPGGGDPGPGGPTGG